MVFLCAAELFVRRAAAGVFFRRAVECSFIELRRVVRRAAVGLSSSCGEFVRRAAVGLSSSCCRECSFVELLSECSLVELLFGTRNSRKNEPSERGRSKQSSEEAVEAMPKTIELFPEVRWPRPFTERVAFRLTIAQHTFLGRTAFASH